MRTRYLKLQYTTRGLDLVKIDQLGESTIPGKSQWNKATLMV